MESEGRSGWIWVAVALFVTLVCCLGLVLVAGAGSAFLLTRQRAGGEPSEVSTVVVTESVETPVVSPEAQAPIPPEAYETESLLVETRVPIADPVELVQRLKGLGEIPEVLATEAEPIPIGTAKTFWVSNTDTDNNFQVETELVYATDHVYFWIEEGVDYDLGDVEDLVDEFEEDIYPTNRSFFGSEWTPGIDGDEHLYLLFARGLGSSIAGYYSSVDSYPTEVHEFSNEHEMFYLSADNLNLASEFTYSVLAHEFQHMIHWNLDSNEETWMNEGFSEVATLINDYGIGGFDRAYASNPDLTLTFWSPEPGTNTANYGQSFLVMSYFLERFGAEATQTLVADAANGLDSVDRAMAELGLVNEESGEPLTANDFYRDWAVAMLLQDPDLEDGRYGFTLYEAPRASISDDISDCPLGPERRTVAPYGVDYIRILCDQPHEIVFDGANVTQVVPADPHSGEYAFWSNRGDTSDMTMTRSFDLSDAEGEIEFSYWTWYDIEENWDYLYLEASTDGGESWQILTTPSGTDTNPQGNSYGWGYTGQSGGSTLASWVEETVALTQFAGEQVLLRFEYVTDAAVNGEGLMVDDLSIPAIDYQEDFETGAGGWQAEGFARIFNRLPQEFRLVLIERGEGTQIREVPLAEGARANIEVPFGQGVDEAFLVVINTTRHTWQSSPYTFRIAP